MRARFAFVVLILSLAACASETDTTQSASLARDTTLAPTAGEAGSSAEAPPALDVVGEPLTGPLLAAFEDYVDFQLADFGTTRDETTVRHAVVDLSVPEADWEQQGSLDVLVLYEGPGVCGTGGCTLDIASFSVDAEAFIQTGSIGLVKSPIRVSESVSHNRHDLIVHVGGGGIDPFESLLQFDLNGDPQYPDTAQDGTPATPAQIDAAQVVLL